MRDDEFIYKPQDVNYLGFLEAQLRDMTGAASLAYELIQNADDAREENGRFSATTLTFDITADALIVRNDGTFRPVDFQRLQNIAGGGKRQESGVTGAFGLGFLAVYQITDAPEIFSGGRHWIIRPDAPPDQRIQERQIPTDGTRFRLPWAFDPASPVRRTLHIEAVQPDQLDEFAQQMAAAIDRAALFLQRLQRLEVRRSGVLLHSIDRRREDERLLLTSETGHSTSWLLFRGNFAAAAQALRAQYPWQIEARRHSTVEVAIPTDTPLFAGRLYAVLPTADTVPLAFHLNADFFPTTDRKRVHFDSGFQAAWNHAAVAAAAALLADKLLSLRDALTPPDLWHLLQSAADCAAQAARGRLPAPFAAFWQQLQPRLADNAVFPTAAGRWLRPAAGRLLAHDTDHPDETATALLAALEIPVLHPELTPFTPLLRRIGTPAVSVGDIAAGLRRRGLTEPTPLYAAPPFLRRLEDWQPLWSLLEDRLRGLPPATRAPALQELQNCAIAPDRMMHLRPLRQLVRGRSEAQAIFPDAAWLHPGLPEDRFPGHYVPVFNVRAAVNRLQETPADRLQQMWQRGQLDLPRLFRWFEREQIEIFADDPALMAEIRRLPLCPVDGELQPLRNLFLPGGFDDPLQLAGVVDVAALGGRRQFFRDLGVAALDFDTYLHSYLPQVMTRTDLPSDGRHRLLALLAARLGEFRDDRDLQAILQGLPLIPCLDGAFRPAAEIYASREVTALLGTQVHIAEPVESAAQQALYDWLGVRHIPSAADLVGALLAISTQTAGSPLDPDSGSVVTNCWQALAEMLQTGAIAAAALAPLRDKPVIPDGGGRLQRPETMALADRSDLAEQFRDWSTWMLPADLGWAAAAAAVGVRPLSAAVTTIIPGHAAAVPAAAVQALLHQRQPLLERLLRAETAAGRAIRAAVINHLTVRSLPGLQKQSRLELGGQTATAPPERAAAVWVDGILYLDGGMESVPWTAAARELARALAPDRPMGGLALGIKEVLAAESSAKAAAMLDELGYP